MASVVMCTLLAVCFYVGISRSAYTEGPLAVVYSEMGGSVTLHCPSASPGVTHTWYKGFINELLYVEEADRTLQKILVTQASTGELTWKTGRDDITVDADLNLTIGSVQFADKTVFTCVSNTSVIAFDFTRLEVYRPPTSGRMVHVQEGNTVTLSCDDTVSGVDRFWFDDLVIDTNRPDLYSQVGSGQVTLGSNPRGSHVSVDPNSFALTISDAVISDRRYYTCVTNYTDKAPIYAITFVNVYSTAVVKEVEEFTSVTIESKRPGVGWSSTWTHGLRGIIYSGQQEIEAYSNRSDMTLDLATFDLTIGMARLEDDTFITAVTSRHPLSTNAITRVKVYIQPFIVGLEYKQYTPGETLTFTCVIHRVYPRLAENAFQMLWLGTTKNATSMLNSDGSWGYTVELTKSLREEDEGHNVTCKVTPQIGQPVIRSETLTIFGRSTTTPSSTTPTTTTTTATTTTRSGATFTTPTTSRPGPFGSTETTTTRAGLPTAERRNLIPIIAGAVAGSLGLIILVIIIGCCCNRRSGHKGESKSARTTQKEYNNSAFHGDDKDYTEQNGNSHYDT